MTNSFLARLQAGEVLVADGATGTNLQRWDCRRALRRKSGCLINPIGSARFNGPSSRPDPI